MPDFFNPYAFVPPWPQRSDVAELRDRSPEPLGRLHDGRWSGRLRLRITTVTPLLITEQGSNPEGLAERGTRRIAGTPLLASSSVKGSVRSEFEAVTGSRYGVFEGHERRLGYRSSGQESADLVPVRIITVEGHKHALPLDGMAPHVEGHHTVLKAAWVPRYGRRACAPWPADIVHGSKCHAWVVLMRRDSWDGKNKRWKEKFLYWRVLALWPDGKEQPDKPTTENENSESPGRRRHQVEDPVPVHVAGFYVHTNRNIGNKHDERLFFHPAIIKGGGKFPSPIELGDEVINGWSDLLTSYHAAHTEDDIHKRPGSDGKPADASEYLQGTNRASDRPAWSWHLEPRGKELKELMELPVGTLCYAKLSKNGGQVEGLYPVALSRVLDEVSPASLAERAALDPAREHRRLSPADRVFGWVPPSRQREANRDQTKALRGRVRFGAVRTITAEVETIDRGLAVLGAPRPTQDLFYAAETASGDPLRTTPGQQIRNGYHRGQGLRGRKVYPHQPGIDWDSRTRQQWLRHGSGLAEGIDKPAVDSQNAQLLDWVRPGAVFELDLHVEDLDPVELGALIYVLHGRRDGPNERHHKLGGGAPLGFGSVTYQVVAEESALAEGTAWQDFFALDQGAPGPVPVTMEQLDELCDEFIHRVRLPSGLPRHLAAYENALMGFPEGTPVRYPADPANPHSDEDRYEWFVANKSRDGQRAPLGQLDSAGLADLKLPTDPTDPTNPARPQQRGNPRHPQRGRGRR